MLWGWLSLSTILIYLWSLLALWFCYALTWSEALFCWVASCATQFISSQAYFLAGGTDAISLKIHSAQETALDPWWLLLQIGIMAAVYAAAASIFGRRLWWEQLDGFNDRRILRLSLLVWLVVDLTCNYGRMREDWQTPLSNILGILCALFILMFEFSILQESRTQSEKRTVEQLLAREAAQHRIAREVIDYVNIKSHDLKYQLEYLRTHGTGEGLEEKLAEVERRVDRYDDIVVAGNETLSIVLTEKNLYCREYGIKLLTIADGEAISFLEAEDIYALFSNLIDNAIESLREEPDEEKRVIDLNVSRRESMVSITCSNYCGHPVVFEDDLPVTTKADRTRHGFGVKSIRYLVKKYGGNVAFRWEDQRFTAFLFLPWAG